MQEQIIQQQRFMQARILQLWQLHISQQYLHQDNHDNDEIPSLQNQQKGNCTGGSSSGQNPREQITAPPGLTKIPIQQNQQQLCLEENDQHTLKALQQEFAKLIPQELAQLLIESKKASLEQNNIDEDKKALNDMMKKLWSMYTLWKT